MEQLLYELYVAAWCIPAGILIILGLLAIEAHMAGCTFWEFVKPKKKAIEPKPEVETITLNYYIPNEEELREQMLRFTCGHTDKKLSSLEKAKDVERLWREAINRTPYCVECYKSEFVNHRDALDDYFAFGTTTRYPENTSRGFFLKRIEEAAYEQGIDSMLDAYFAGVPVEDILA